MHRLSRPLLGVLAVVAFGIAVFLIPVGSGDSAQPRGEAAVTAQDTEQAESPRPAPAEGSPRVGPVLQPVELSGTIEHVNALTVTIRTVTGVEHQVMVRQGARIVAGVRDLSPDAVRAGDVVEVYTETVTSDAYHPPADIGRIRRIDILADGLPVGHAAQCPAVAIHSGIVSAFGNGRLSIQTPCGDASFEARPDIHVRRKSSATPADLTPGVQVTLTGTQPSTGLVEASLIEVRGP